MSPGPRVLVLIVVMLFALVGPLAERASRGDQDSEVPPRYAIQFDDGTRWTARQLTDWNAARSQPRLDGRTLDQVRSPWRLWIDFQVPAAPLPEAFVEMHFGDRLPGVAVQAARSGSRIRWMVRPSIDLTPPAGARGQSIGVDSQFVRRVVWQRTTSAYQPGLIVHRDGRSWRARSLELGESEVRFLADQGVMRLPYRELAELHAVRSDPWAMYAEMLRRQDPLLAGRLWHWSCGDGLRVTADSSTFAVASAGHAWRPEAWIHSLHPVWSDQPLWVRCGTIGWRQSFEPTRVPLTLIDPIGELGGAPEVNRNARLGWLTVGDGPVAWGWGVRGASRLSVPVPVGAQSLSVRWGLDRVARGRGAAAGRLLWRDAGPEGAVRQLLATEPQSGETGGPGPEGVSIPLPAPNGGELVFEVDPLDTAQPPAAPGSVADFWDWLEPELTLDATAWRAAIQEDGSGGLGG